ncbi:hypothetical protein B0A49_11904 [Cryomyces minteri]|uniref:HAT C-terminal dimerisation domain-containing protein n=1 Tax=Cryomyces minteri TaxID=331657 RepID=A0A4U0X5Z9_9PEZI|nr:hypothetical protein B0A49_11904 [Cryomyces minteri]
MVLLDEISHRHATSKHHKRLACYGNPLVENVYPDSASTVTSWAKDAYQISKATIEDVLSKARSRISLSLDIWTSDSSMPLLGICAHFIDFTYSLTPTLLALPLLEGSHSGATIAPPVEAVVKELGITENLGFFMMDNADNNDTMLVELRKSFPSINIKQQRLRCLGHIVKLTAKAALHGTDMQSFEKDLQEAEEVDARVEDFEAAAKAAISDEPKRLELWRKRGSIGKIHNLVVHVNSSTQRTQLSNIKQKEADESTKHLYNLISDGGVRWSSTHAIIERALKLKDAITLYQQATPDLEVEDVLLPTDWAELVEFKELLVPLAYISTRMQGNATTGSHGALWEWLTSMDYLLGKLEQVKERLSLLPDSHSRTCVNLARMKLNKYYEKSDDTADWIVSTKRAIQKLFEDYQQRYQLPATSQSNNADQLSDFDLSNRIRKTATSHVFKLSNSLPTIDVKQHRLRCLAHVLNLCCKAVLLGTDSDSFEKGLKDKDTIDVDDRIGAFEAAVTSKQDLEKRLKEWRKKGPIGKAHNLVIHVNSSDQRRQLPGQAGLQAANTGGDKQV